MTSNTEYEKDTIESKSSRDYSVMAKANKHISRPLKCLNDGKIFDSIKQAAEFHKIPLNKMYDVMKGSKFIFGLEFEFLPKETIVTRNKLLPKVERPKLVNTHKPKRVFCIETSTWYNSRVEAAKDLGVSTSSIIDSLKDGRTHAGYTFTENPKGENVQ